jgi:hypothetical protein
MWTVEHSEGLRTVTHGAQGAQRISAAPARGILRDLEVLAYGHVAPLRPIAADLVRRSEQVTFLTGSAFRASVEDIPGTPGLLLRDLVEDLRKLTIALPERQESAGRSLTGISVQVATRVARCKAIRRRVVDRAVQRHRKQHIGVTRPVTAWPRQLNDAPLPSGAGPRTGRLVRTPWTRSSSE